MSQQSVNPNFAYDLMRVRQNCLPLTVSRRFNNSFLANPSITLNLFKASKGYQTVIGKFSVMMDFGPFGPTNFLRAGLRANGQIMDGQIDASFTNNDDNYHSGVDTLKGNGFTCISFLNGINDYNFNYLLRPGQQLSCVISLFDPSVDPYGGSVGGVVTVAGAQLAA